MGIRGEASASVRGGGGAPPPVKKEAPAAMPSRGHGNPRRGISVSSRRGWGPAAIEEESACGHAEPRTWESEARHQRQFAAGVGPRRQLKKKAPAAMPSRGHGNPRRGISVSSRRGWGPAASEKK